MCSHRCRRRGYIWTPGYGLRDAVYWVPGVWGVAAESGRFVDAWLLGIWGAFMRGIPVLGPHVGFYGGVNSGWLWRDRLLWWRVARRGVCVQPGGGELWRVHVTNVYEDRTVIEHNTIVNATT